MQSSIERRIARLEAVLHERDSAPLRIFATVIGRPLQGFVAHHPPGPAIKRGWVLSAHPGFVAHHPPGPAIARQDGESVEALEARCAAEAPGVQIWRST